jgi:hypothetical protein
MKRLVLTLLTIALLWPPTVVTARKDAAHKARQAWKEWEDKEKTAGEISGGEIRTPKAPSTEGKDQPKTREK